MNQIKIVFFLALIILLGLGTLGAAVIQTQAANDNENIVAELSELTINSNIVTIKVRIFNKGNENSKLDFYFKDCYIIDEANQKKYYILKDSEGLCIGGPFSSNGDGGRFEFWTKPQSAKSIWAKFPMPTDNPGSISISVPGFMPFEAIKLALK